MLVRSLRIIFIDAKYSSDIVSNTPSLVILANGHYAVPFVSHLSSTKAKSDLLLIDSRSRRFERVYRAVSWSSNPLQNIPFAYPIHKQESFDNWQLCLRPRHLPRPPEYSPAPHSCLPPFSRFLGGTFSPKRHCLETNNKIFSPQRAHRFRG